MINLPASKMEIKQLPNLPRYQTRSIIISLLLQIIFWKKRKYKGNKSYKDYLPQSNPNSIALHLCDEAEIKTIISFLDFGKVCGPNSIPNHLLHLLKEDISRPLALLFNLSLSTGTLPDFLKISKTILIFKKGSRLLVSNFRPISLLYNLNKILENNVFASLQVDHKVQLVL